MDLRALVLKRIPAVEQEGLAYASLCREERHFAAVLFGLMCSDEAALRRFVLEMLTRSGRSATCLGMGRLTVFYEYSYLRDLWARVDKEPGAVRRRPRALSNPDKREIILCGLGAFGRSPEDAPMDPQSFNGIFTSNPSMNDIMSPATWQLNTDFADSDLHRSAALLKTAFKIKPDIVIELDAQPLLCIEAKVESGQSYYRLDDSLRIGQVDMQRRMFSQLLGVDPLVVLLKNQGPDEGADLAVSWADAFSYFPGAPLMRREAERRLAQMLPARPDNKEDLS